MPTQTHPAGLIDLEAHARSQAGEPMRDRAIRAEDPYQFSIAHFKERVLDRENRTITFVFADMTALTFKISYTPVEVE